MLITILRFFVLLILATAPLLGASLDSDSQSLYLLGSDGKIYRKGVMENGWVSLKTQLPSGVLPESITVQETTTVLGQKSSILYVLGADGILYSKDLSSLTGFRKVNPQPPIAPLRLSRE